MIKPDVKHQFNALSDHASHRLVVDGEAGPWESYESPAIFKGHIALSPYYTAGDYTEVAPIGALLPVKSIEVCGECGQAVEDEETACVHYKEMVASIRRMFDRQGA